MSQHSQILSKQLKSMVAELKNLRLVRKEFEYLINTLDELGISAKQSLRVGKNSATAAGLNKTRIRSTNKELLAQYRLLTKKLPVQWSTREEICKEAGLDTKEVDVPFMWLIMGCKDENKKELKPVLIGNGRRGLAGAYKKL